jgi:hypothetical protein
VVSLRLHRRHQWQPRRLRYIMLSTRRRLLCRTSFALPFIVDIVYLSISVLHVRMQHQRHPPSRRTPTPDMVRFPSSAATPQPPPHHPTPPAQNPAFLIIGLFEIRLAKQLIEDLETYLERDADTAWIACFHAPYPLEFALAKISGPRREDYATTYHGIVFRMKSQPRYPFRFMQMNPDRSLQRRQGLREAAKDDANGLTDRK